MAEPTHKNILYLIDDVTGSSWYRCNTPGAELARRGHNVRIKQRFNQADLDWADVLVLQRLWQRAVLEAAAYVRGRGRLTVFDVDDDYWSIHTTNPAYASWQTPGALDALASVIRACNRVTTTTETLASRLRSFNADVRVIPNSLPSDYWPSKPKDLDHEGPVIIGWAGSNSHFIDLREVSAIFPQVLDQYPNVRVHLAGGHPSWLVPHKRLQFIDPVPIEDYPGLLEGFDIGLAPLEDTRFNASKSDLKLVEYAMIGLPIIASKVPTYTGSIRPGETALLARNPKDWLRHIRALVEHVELRAGLGAEARKWAETRVISKAVGMWEDAYGLACERQDHLPSAGAMANESAGDSGK